MGHWDHISADDASEGAAIGLLALMQGISEELWCAGWLIGLERSLWAARNSAEPVRFGNGAITSRQCRLLADLSEEAGGWWTYGDDGAAFVRTEEWVARLASPSPEPQP
jgi:hypothetical protein